MSFCFKDNVSRFWTLFVRGVLLAVTVQLLAMAFLASYLLSKHNLVEAGMIYDLESLISSSHLPKYFFFDFPMGVDARSLGLLFGAFLGLASHSRLMDMAQRAITSRPVLRPSLWLGSVIAVLPFVFSLFVQIGNSNSINFLFLVGLTFGLTVTFHLVPIVASSAAFVWVQFARFFATVWPARS